MIKLTQYLGFFPDTSQIENEFFNMQDGVFQAIKSHDYCVQGTHVLKFKQFLGTTFEESMNIALSRQIRSDILTMLLVYFKLHLHGFKKPKSLSVLSQIFN